MRQETTRLPAPSKPPPLSPDISWSAQVREKKISQTPETASQLDQQPIIIIIRPCQNPIEIIRAPVVRVLAVVEVEEVEGDTLGTITPPGQLNNRIIYVRGRRASTVATMPFISTGVLASLIVRASGAPKSYFTEHRLLQTRIDGAPWAPYPPPRLQ